MLTQGLIYIACFAAGMMTVAAIDDIKFSERKPSKSLAKADQYWLLANAPFRIGINKLSVQAAVASDSLPEQPLLPPDEAVPEPVPIPPESMASLNTGILQALRDRDDPKTFRNYPESEQLNGTFRFMRSGNCSGRFSDGYTEPFINAVSTSVQDQTLTITITAPLRGERETGTIEPPPSIFYHEDMGRLWRLTFAEVRRLLGSEMLQGYDLILRINPILPIRGIKLASWYEPPTRTQYIRIGMMRQDYGKINWDSTRHEDDYTNIHSGLLEIRRAR